MKIAEWPLPDVRIVCLKCGLESTIPRDEIEVVFGPDTDLFSLRQEMTASCVPTKNEVCQSRLADALLVQAINQPDLAKVVDKSLLPAAREWREKLGMKMSEFDSSGS
ncbi:hypothetical protein [Methylobacterium sp. WL120]|uniref:hypothetical protein n=1 Tax=Methylobacterium sp. WL120 TaxID=2603887 RepID=UPI0011C9547A|nr:hypothetical protein [Methylobacterium sp. WL120]TXM68317.1 hypothetical protein FV229_08075 [Methylobacterium sp. WL120]